MRTLCTLLGPRGLVSRILCFTLSSTTIVRWSSSAHGYPFDKALVTDSNPGKALIAEQLFHRPVVRDRMWLGFPCSLAKAHGLTYFFRLD